MSESLTGLLFVNENLRALNLNLNSQAKDLKNFVLQRTMFNVDSIPTCAAPHYQLVQAALCLDLDLTKRQHAVVPGAAVGPSSGEYTWVFATFDPGFQASSPPLSGNPREMYLR